MTRFWKVVAVVGVFVAVAVVGVLVYGGDDTERDPSTARTSSAQPAAIPPFTQDRATEISTSLAAGDEASFRSAVAVPVEQPLNPDLVAALSSATPIFDLATITELADGAVTVEADVMGPAPARWVVYLIWDGSVWKISATGVVQ